MSQENIALVTRAYEAFTRGDIPAILELCADRLEQWEVVSDGPAGAPWHKPVHTHAEVAGFFQALVGALEPLKFEWQHLASNGPYVYATTQQQYRVRKTGRMLVMRDTMHRFHIVDGRVVGWIANEDSAQTRAALDA
jgi:ketosteroid isomerase-like protein